MRGLERSTLLRIGLMITVESTREASCESYKNELYDESLCEKFIIEMRGRSEVMSQKGWSMKDK